MYYVLKSRKAKTLMKSGFKSIKKCITFIENETFKWYN